MGLDTSGNQNVPQHLASLGLKTFPLKLNSKVPPEGESWLRRVESRPAHDYDSGNLAVATGCGLIVLDFDNKPDKNGMATLSAWDMLDKLPQSLRVSTPSGGVHVYLSVPDGSRVANSQSRLAPGVDVRGENGYVVAPGSMWNGLRYQILCDGPIAPAPEWLLADLPAPHERVELGFDVDMDTDHNVKRATDYLRHHAPAAIEGQAGDLTTFKVACRVKDFGVSEGMCHSLMLEHWNSDPERVSPAWSDDGLAAKVSSAYRNGSLPPGIATAHAEFGDDAIPPEVAERMMAAKPEARESRMEGVSELGRPWATVDPDTLPRTRFLYGGFFARGYTSLTIAAPKVGKSLLTVAECVDMATGRHTLLPSRDGTVKETQPLKVAYFNAEDEMATLQARVLAALSAAGATQRDIEGRLSIHSGIDGDPLHLLAGDPPQALERQFARLESWIARERLDVLILDPLQDLSAADESNMVFRVLGQRLRRLAAETNVAIGLVHHTRKVEVGRTPVIDDGRGGSALRGTSRFNRVLVAMTEEEGVKARLPDEGWRRMFRIGDVESNLAPPSASINRWFEKHEVDINPGGLGGRFPIAAIRGWEWPDASEGVSQDDVAAVVERVRQEETHKDGPLRSHPKSERWVGRAVAEVLSLVLEDDGERARIRELIVMWTARGYLRTVEHEDKRQGRSVKCVAAGEAPALTLSSTKSIEEE